MDLVSTATALTLTATLAIATVTDLRARIIPDRLTFPAAALGLLLAVTGGPATVAVALSAAVLGAAPFLAANRMRPDSMGMGDVKLVTVLGLLLGPAVLPVMLVALGSAGGTGALVALAHGRRPSAVTLPLAPFLALGAAAIPLASAMRV